MSPSVSPDQAISLPPPPGKAFLIGIGGIGMSSLAQCLVWLGYQVGGSDRDLQSPGRTELLRKLELQGITIYPQDGSGVRAFQPDICIVSAAVEEGNPDLIASKCIPAIHRAKALADAIDGLGCTQIAVAGSCGKTSVTGWIAQTLRAMGKRVLVVNGGYILDCESGTAPGNFSSETDPEFAVFEVDESDKSLVLFSPDCGVLLNIGEDHYEHTELTRVFETFLENCRSSVVLPLNLHAQLAHIGPNCRAYFGELGSSSGPPGIVPTGYVADNSGISFEVNGIGRVKTRQYGHHSATNACAVIATVTAVCPDADPDDLRHVLSAFSGIRQRFEKCGELDDGSPVFCDYAHNVEKIAAAIQTVKEATGSPVTFVFQPHGYGPLGFMQDALGTVLGQVLTKGDSFHFLPVYYAGGTTSFSPTSADVMKAYAAMGLPVYALPDRELAAEHLAPYVEASRALLVMGARDPSLPKFVENLTVQLGGIPVRH